MRMDNCEFATYLTIDGSLRIPDHKPDIKQIVQVVTAPIMNRVIVQHHKIIFYGEIGISLTYSTNVYGETQLVHFKVPFANFINHYRALPAMYAKLSNEIEIQNFFVRDSRLISKFIFLKIGVVELKQSCTIRPQQGNTRQSTNRDRRMDHNKSQSSHDKKSILEVAICSKCKQPPNKSTKNDKLITESNGTARKKTLGKEVSANDKKAYSNGGDARL